mgnify:CR=1 FL=1
MEGYSDKISEIERKLTKLGGGVEKQLEELSTVKIEKLTRTVSNDRPEKEDKINNPQTGLSFIVYFLPFYAENILKQRVSSSFINVLFHFLLGHVGN